MLSYDERIRRAKEFSISDLLKQLYEIDDVVHYKVRALIDAYSLWLKKTRHTLSKNKLPEGSELVYGRGIGLVINVKNVSSYYLDPSEIRLTLEIAYIEEDDTEEKGLEVYLKIPSCIFDNPEQSLFNAWAEEAAKQVDKEELKHLIAERDAIAERIKTLEEKVDDRT